jgi:hypothetical protein
MSVETMSKDTESRNIFNQEVQQYSLIQGIKNDPQFNLSNHELQHLKMLTETSETLGQSYQQAKML